MASRWFKQHAAQPLPDDPAEVLAVGYVRVSSKNQFRRGLSPDAQRREIVDYIAEMGWELGTVYQDVQRGTDNSRPNWQALREAVRSLRKQGRFVVVVAVAVDRTGRDIGELDSFRNEVRELTGQTPYYVEAHGQITDDQADDEHAGARKEVRRIARRVARSKNEVALLGLPPSGRPAWGYYWRLPASEDEVRAQGYEDRQGRVATRRILDIDPVAAPAVRELFQRIADGKSVYATIAWVAGLSETIRGGRKLRRRNVIELLRSAVYVARYTRDDIADPDAILKLKPGRWPALVDDATWRAVQRRLRDHTTRPGRGRPSTAGNLLTGRLVCPKCGSKMYAGPRPDGAPIYRCASRLLGAGVANTRCACSANQTAIEAVVRAELAQRLARLSTPAMRAHYQTVWPTIQPRMADPAADAQRASLARTLETAKTQLRALEQLAGVLDDATLTASKQTLLATISDANGALDALPAPVTATALPELPALLDSGRAWYQRLQSADGSQQHTVVRELIARVVPVRLSAGHGAAAVMTARIVWTAVGWLVYRLTDSIGTDADACPADGTPARFRADGAGTLARVLPSLAEQQDFSVYVPGAERDVPALETVAAVALPLAR